MAEGEDLKKSPLDALHRALGARMVPFAGFEMPLNYGPGILKEHLHCRNAAALFDVSHMGPILVQPLTGDIADAAAALERLMPVDVAGLAPNRQRYGFLTDEAGGILDDLLFANRDNHFYVVVNAVNYEAIGNHIAAGVSDRRCAAGPLRKRAMVALQGPQAAAALSGIAPEAADMRFMDIYEITVADTPCLVSRSGYTGEDGYEISIPVDAADHVARALLAHEAVEPAGLGARDSLRLEAGLCLYGNDIDTTTSPVEAGLSWAIQKVRRAGGARAGGFPGADRILGELENGPARRLVGLRPQGRAPVRAGAPLHAGEGGALIGQVTSGVFGPSVGAPVAMGYVDSAHAAPGTTIVAEVRGKPMPVTTARLPFIKTGYKR